MLWRGLGASEKHFLVLTRPPDPDPLSFRPESPGALPLVDTVPSPRNQGVHFGVSSCEVHTVRSHGALCSKLGVALEGKRLSNLSTYCSPRLIAQVHDVSIPSEGAP